MDRLLFLLLTLMIVNNPMVHAQPANLDQLDRNSIQLKGTPINAQQWGMRSLTGMRVEAENYYWSFDDADFISQWNSIDNDGDGRCWEYYETDGYQSPGCVFSSSYDMMPLNPDNWLVSPQVKLNGTLSLWAKNYLAYFPDQFAVYVCIGDPTGIQDFVKISNDICPPNYWANYTFDLSGYGGQTGCFAIRHYDSYDMFHLFIDDISITNEDTPPEITESPEITIDEYSDGVFVTATGQGHICLYVNNQLVGEGEGTAYYFIEAGYDDEWYVITATAQAEGMEISEPVSYELIVPHYRPNELPAPVITFTLTDETAIFTAVGEGTVYLYINYLDYWTEAFSHQEVVSGSGEVTYEIPRGEEDILVTVKAVCEEEGAIPGSTSYEYYVIPAIELLPEFTEIPVFTCEVTDNGVIITVTGEGFVFLLLGDEIVAEGEGYVTYEIPAGDEEQVYEFFAYAQAEGKEPSEVSAFTVVVPAKPAIVRGDADGDGQVTVSDVTALIDYLLSYDSGNINLEGADFNQDGTIDISDITAIIDFILTGAM